MDSFDLSPSICYHVIMMHCLTHSFMTYLHYHQCYIILNVLGPVESLLFSSVYWSTVNVIGNIHFQIVDRVCGSDGQIYNNECELRVSSCQRQVEITIASQEICG